MIEVRIDQAGRLKSFGKASGNYALVDAVKNAVRRWQWEPTVMNKEAVEVASEVAVEFVK